MAPEHERYRRQAQKQIMDDSMAKWEAEHPSEPDDETPADAVNPAPVPAEPEPVKDEPVDLIRMMPPPAQDAQEPVVEDVAAPSPDPVDEAEAPTEMPPVADHVAQAARELAIQVWSLGLIPHPGPHLDQLLAHAVSLGWLVVDADRIVRGKVDPRPVSVTSIPNF